MAKLSPKVYKLADLPKDWENKVLELFSAGSHLIEVRVELGIHHRVHNRLMNESESYRDLFEWGWDLAYAYHIKLGRDGITGEKTNGSIYKYTMSNRFNWRETPLSPDKDAPSAADEAHEEETIVAKYGGQNDFNSDGTH